VSDAGGETSVPEQEAAPGVTAGSAPPAPEEAAETVAASPLVCPICGHADAAHVDSGRCLVMLGAYGTEGACPCPEPRP